MTPSATPSGTVSGASDDAAVAEVAGHLRLSVTRLNRVLRQQADLGLTPTRLAHLATINRVGPLSLGDLSALEHVAPPTVTKVINDLERRGLVQRLPDTADRRITRVAVTDEGRRTIEAIRSRKDLWLAVRLRDLPPEDFERLAAAVEVLERLTAPAD